MNSIFKNSQGLLPVLRFTVVFGLCLGCFVSVLHLMNYQYFIRNISSEFYIGLVAILFSLTGVWIGLRVAGNSKKQERTDEKLTATHNVTLEDLGLTKRELEVLQHMSEGLSNQEIADKLFVSLNTIKTHSSNIYIKLNAKRRTQAISIGKELGIIS